MESLYERKLGTHLRQRREDEIEDEYANANYKKI